MLGTIFTGAYYDKEDPYYKSGYHWRYEPVEADKWLKAALEIDTTHKKALLELCLCYCGRYGFEKTRRLKDNLEQLRLYYAKAIEAGYEEDEDFIPIISAITDLETAEKEINGLFENAEPSRRLRYKR